MATHKDTRESTRRCTCRADFPIGAALNATGSVLFSVQRKPAQEFQHSSAQFLVTSTDVGVVVTTAANRATVWITDLASGEPVADAPVQLLAVRINSDKPVQVQRQMQIAVA